MKRLIQAVITATLLVGFSFAQQPLSLQRANELAQKHYPLMKQKDLLTKTTALTLDNISSSFLPQVTVSTQASYQSDVTQVKIPLPGVSINPPSKDQYKLVSADVSQLLYDGGLSKEQKNIQALTEETEQQKIEVELYKVKDRVNQLFFGIMFLDEQLKQVELIKKDINTGIKKTEAMVNNGVAFRSNLNVLKAELLKTEQRTIELKASRKGLLDVLGLFTGETYDEKTALEKPLIQAAADTAIHRPELHLFSSQEKFFDSQLKLIDAKLKPKASAFLQTGYAKPGLNLFKNEFAFYYLAGLRLNWSLSGLYNKTRHKELVALNKKNIDIQKETFLLNTNASLKQQQAEIDKLNQLIEKDNEIIELRVKVKEAAKAQLENGVITANDYLREINAEDQARQALITHQVQLLQAQINYQTILGK